MYKLKQENKILMVKATIISAINEILKLIKMFKPKHFFKLKDIFSKSWHSFVPFNPFVLSYVNSCNMKKNILPEMIDMSENQWKLYQDKYQI